MWLQARVGSQHASTRGKVQAGRWKLGGEIGKGSFGNVHIGLNEDTGELIAVKQLSLAQPGMPADVSA